MPTIKILSWHDDIKAKAASLKARGLQIDAAPLIKPSSVVSELASLNPAVLILDLDRLPSHAREITVLLRSSKSARHIPILFAGGLPEKIERIRNEFPGAPMTSWADAPRAIAALLKNPPTTPVAIPVRNYSGTPLPQKLGIRAEMQVALIAAPDGFEETLGDLPDDVDLTTRLTSKTNLALCFVRSLDDLVSTVDILTLRLPKAASVWIIYPKRTSRHRADFNENHVRNQGLANNLVDYKVCSVDNDWSGLKFAWRKKPVG